MNGAAVVIEDDDGNARIVGRAEQEIAEGRSGEVAGEVVVAIVVAGGEAEVGFSAEFAQIEAELDGMAAVNPGEVVDELGGPTDGATGASLRKAGHAVNREIGQGVEEDVLLN